ncbi:hypothetical protein FNV43_RR03342 [Rhamnella rubrinervis]|uniref:DUF4220 domain-containing protein n=1 Tax=Rhamnella rubrinervis TaxID=2594499 RepID=A0A8K0HJP9_9ROSA|nr:hypothetical protein FNV43_RR03342 [Rhamnella rubrinervis]
MQFNLMPRRLKDFWDEWGIEMLVAVSCVMHIVLTLFGSRRKQIKNILVRFIIWSAYLLSDYVVTVIFGKLTIIPVSDSTREITDSELRALLAPLLLVQLGSRDAITAYSIEDNRLGLRQILSLFAQCNAVFWILFRCWTNSPVSYLYLPLLMAGFIKYGENVWALSTALTGSSGLTITEFDEEGHVPKIFKDLPTDIPNQKMITTAYYRFVCLKPHIDNWLYKPLYQVSVEYTSIDRYTSQEKFRITDLELGFMYDVLYTKFPVIYTWIGLALRLISSITLFSISIAFCILFKDSFVYYINAGFTFVVLGVILTLECYQIYMLVFSDWAIVGMVKHRSKPAAMRFLRALAPQSSKRKRWSNKLDQFNLINYCLDQKKYDYLTKLLSFTRFFKFQGWDTEIKKYLCKSTSVRIYEEFKEMLIQEMKKVDEKRGSKPVDKRGTWALIRSSFNNESAEMLKRSVEDRDFDKSIVIWHLATEICYHNSDTDQKRNPTSKIEMGRLLSNYMMYLLAVQSQMLCITTSDIVFDHACEILTEFLTTSAHGDYSKNTRDDIVSKACKDLREGNFVRERGGKTMVTEDWKVLEDSRNVSEHLTSLHGDHEDAMWELICSVWVEMLCFAATNCPADNHSEQLRRGGEIVTHVWLLLLHNTDADPYLREKRKDR